MRSHDLSGKSVVPIITHGGYGPGNALQTARAPAPNAAFTTPFVLECNQERDDLRRLDQYLDEQR